MEFLPSDFALRPGMSDRWLNMLRLRPGAKTLLGAPDIATRSRDAISNKCIASSNKCLTSSNKNATRGSWHRY